MSHVEDLKPQAECPVPFCPFPSAGPEKSKRTGAKRDDPIHTLGFSTVQRATEPYTGPWACIWQMRVREWMTD